MKKILSFIFIFLFFSSPGFSATVRELYEQAVDAYNSQEFDRAIGFYQEIIKQTPHFAPAYVGIGLALKSKRGDDDEVLYYYKTATEMDPTNAQAFEQLGRLYYSLSKFDKAERAFLKALKIDPGLASVKSALGWIYLLGKQNPLLAIKYFKAVLKQTPNPESYLGLGMAYFANNDRVQALEMITFLRKEKHDDFANRLEKMVRENRKIRIEPKYEEPEPAPAQVNTDRRPESIGVLVSSPTNPVLPAPTQHENTGFRVRLRGKLSEVDK